MAYDALLTPTGSQGGVGQSAMRDTLAAGANNLDGVFVGSNRDFTAHLIVPAAPTGDGSPTIDVKLQDSADGSSFADMGIAFAQLTAIQTAVLQKSGRTTNGRPYVRGVATVSAGDTFSNVVLTILPTGETPFRP